MSEIDPTGGGAACALHASSPAVAVCERCGSYMCEACTGGGAYQSCPTCRAAQGSAFDLSRTDWSVDRVFSRAWDAWKQQWLMLSLGMLIFIALMYAVVFVLWLFVGVLSGVLGAAMAPSSGGAPPSDAFFVVLAVVTEIILIVGQISAQSVLQLGMVRICIDAVEGRTVDLARLFGQFRKIGKVLLQIFVIGVVAGLPMVLYGALIAGGLALAGQTNHDNVVLAVAVIAGLLVIVPYMWLALGFTFAQLELVFDDDVGAIAAIRRSFKLVSGYRLPVFAVVLLGGLVAVSGFFACCIGLLASASFAQVITCVLYLALRNGSGLPAPKNA